MSPLISIVIANYNYGRFLEDAIRSVIGQDVDCLVELIVCDGGSTDNSVDIIKKYEDKIAWWCSEKDKGQSDAFNKGFVHAKGKYLTWLNADDVLVNGCLKKVVQTLKKYPEEEWFTGNYYRYTDDGSVIEIGWGPHWYPKWTQRRNSPIVVFGPSSIFTKRLFEEMGGFDINMHLMMDTDMWVRFIVAGVKQRRISHFIWGFRMHEKSKTAEFGEHKVPVETAMQFHKENDLMLSKTGYNPSKFWRMMSLGMRVIDGSLIRKWFYKFIFRRVAV